MKKQYIVYGWLNGEMFDLDNPADITTKVTAESPSKAEDIADKRFKKKIGSCEVIDCIELP